MYSEKMKGKSTSFPHYLLLVVSALLFFYGFFPVSRTNEKLANDPPTHINSVNLNKQVHYTSQLSKFVLIIIDALRYDFVSPELMPLTSKLFQSNGCMNRVRVEAPTVTLPRIKAMMAGNIPQFIDMVLNLASTEVLKDSLIHSAYKKGKSILFYGDDTWLKLFPNYFTRYEGIHSFFVRDFSLDDNVTRNVDIELRNVDWDIMILHYLGLDHIGHVYGPSSPLIPGKLKEMDEVIYRIYKNISAANDTLIVVTGDHGMRDSGGHGGSSYSETNVPFLVIGLQCDDSYFPQTDIPVNLAVLLGLDIPSSTIGKIQRSLLTFTLEKYLYVLRYNALLLQQKSCVCDDQFEQATILHEEYLKNFDERAGFRATELYDNCSETIRNNMIKLSVEQNFSSLVIAILIMFNVLFMLLLKIFMLESTIKEFETISISVFFMSIVLHFCSFFDSLFFIVILALVLISFENLSSMRKVQLKFSNYILNFLVSTSVIHPLTFISSSFIEEEHQFWYFFSLVLIFFVAINISRSNLQELFHCFALAVALRFLRTINSTGDKWLNLADFSDWLLKSENEFSYHVFSLLGLILTFIAQYNLVEAKGIIIHLANLLIMSLIFIFKIYETVFLGRVIWFSILCHAVMFRHSSRIISWTLISTLLLKPYNVILLPYCIFSSLFFSKYFQNIHTLILYHIWLGNMLFFAQGHSNSLASVDVSIGYIGLEDYQPVLVIGQVLCHTYVFNVLCHFLIFRYRHIDRVKVWDILFCSRLYIFIVVCSLTFMFRNHIFIWSVFAPKLFIECTHVGFLFVEYVLYEVHNYLWNKINRLWTRNFSLIFTIS